jgi:predicted acylesterase/phospholipase RssA
VGANLQPQGEFSMMDASTSAKQFRIERSRFEQTVLLLQGGGALGSYQAGVYQALAEANLHPDWVAGISIGAVNAALIAGNPPEKRVEKLQEFWEAVSTPPLIGLAKVVAKEGAAHGVRANVICPGFVRTPLVDKQIPEQAKELGISEQEVIKNIMLKETVDGEFTTVDDVAETALFLASFGSNALTGQSIVVSHGWFMQ